MNLVQQLTQELTESTKHIEELDRIIKGLFEIATPGTIKNSLWARYQELKQDEPTARPDAPKRDDDGWSEKLAERGY